MLIRCSTIPIAAALAALFACDPAVAPPKPQECTRRLESGCWTHLGLEGKWITALAATERGLYAGTHDDGLLRLDPDTEAWEPLGLDHAIVSSILFVSTPAPRLLVGVAPVTDETTTAAVFASDDRGASWYPWDGGLAARRGERGWAYSLAMEPGNSERLYMGYFNRIVRSEDGGRTWHFVWGEEASIGGGKFWTILVAPQRDGRVWAGGQSALFTAMTVRSTDWGETWEFVDPTPRADNTVRALALDPANPDALFAGAGGGVIRSNDGGRTWTYVLSQVNGVVFALAVTAEAIYALSAEDFTPEPEKPLGLYRSRDGGESWERLATPEAAGGGQALAVGQRGVLLIGTRGPGGVWRLEP
jgi:hypothetical protein